MTIQHEEARKILAEIEGSFEYEDPYEVITLCDLVSPFYETNPVDENDTNNLERAKLALWKGVAVRRTGDMKVSVELLDVALKFFSILPLEAESEANILRLSTLVHRASALLQDHAVLTALDDLEIVVTALDSLVRSGVARARSELVGAQTQRGLALVVLGQYDDAMKTYDAILESLAELDGPTLDFRNFLRAQTLRYRAQLWRKMQAPNSAADDLEEALALIPEQDKIISQMWFLLLSDILVSLALANWNTANLAKAEILLDRSEKILFSQPLSKRKDLNVRIAELYLNLATVLRRKGDHQSSLSMLDKSLEYADIEVSSGRRKLETFRARLLMNRGVYKRELNDIEGALADHQQSLALFFSSPLVEQNHLEPSRARNLAHLAGTLRKKGKFTEAVERYGQALETYNGRLLQQRSDLDTPRALIHIYLGNALFDLSNFSGSLSSYHAAEAFFEGPTIGPWTPRNANRCTLYVNMVKLLSEISRPHDWAREKSSRMSAMLELAPPELAGPWAKMRRSFRTFHERWLSFAVHEGAVEPIPEILAALQGQDVAADVLDRLALEVAQDSGTDKAILAYQAARAELRRLVESIREDTGSETSEDRNDNPDIGNRSLRLIVVSAPPPLQVQRQTKLLEDYRVLHNRLSALREAAATVPGFAILRAPHRQLTQGRLREMLAKDEALLLAFVHDGVARVAILRGDGTNALIELPLLDDRVESIERFSRSMSAARRGLRDGPWSPVNDASEKPRETAAFDKMSDAELAAFWDETAEAQRSKFWAPLAEALAGIKSVIGVTHGRLQLTALSAGAPPDVEIVRYPGLAFYALAQGLYGDTTKPSRTSDLIVSIVRGDHSDLHYSQVEEQKVAAVWRSAGVNVSQPNYPRQQGVGLLHVISHGGLLPDGTPVILLNRDKEGKRQTISERDILRGVPVDAAFLNLCLGGRLSENPLDGSPSGLVSALMRRGARVVVAALPPVDDLWACVLGMLVAEAMASDRLALDRALMVAKQQLRQGPTEHMIASLRDWNVAQLNSVIRARANVHRESSAEVCARAIMRAALGTLENTTLLAQLTAALTAVPKNDRASIAESLLAGPASEPLVARLAQGPSPAEYGALVHGMIAYGKSAAAA